MARLIVIKGTDEGKQFELGPGVLGIGRDATSTARLHDTEVSRRHAEIRPAAGGFSLHDVGSANGTFVNGQPVQDAALHSGDQIQVGQTMLVYSAGQAGSPPASSDLADRIRMITRQDVELTSAIVKTINEGEGSRILAQPEKAGGPWLKTALANLRIMYETSQAVSHILDLDQLLERIMELIFRSIAADRGCIMLLDPDSGVFVPKAVRWRSRVDGQEKIELSRTIMDYVLREKQGVLVADAARDMRFQGGQSIFRFGIQEVICVPMKGRHETLGVLYLDTRIFARELAEKQGSGGSARFDEDQLALAIAIAHQAALAVEETRYHQGMLQAERLAAIGQTIAALSHHVKNILQGLRSGSDILKMGLTEKNDDLLQQGWRLFEKSQGKIYDLVMDMLSYSKEREPAFEEIDLNQIVQEVVELSHARAKEIGAHLACHPERNLPRVLADPEGIHRAVLNVVANALDAVEARPQPQVMVVTSREPETGWALITVLDNGVGIPEEKHEEIFKPFVSTKGSRGTGLGLAVSRKILREHGGDIVVQSQAGQGSKMILRLPLRSAIGEASQTGNLTPLKPSLPEDE